MPGYTTPKIDHNLYKAMMPQTPIEEFFKLGMMKQQMYNQGVDTLKQKVSSMNDLSSGITNPEIKKVVEDFNKKAQQKLKDYTSLDFSMQDNVNLVNKICDPLLNDKLVLGDYQVTSAMQSQMQNLRDMSISDKKEVRDMYNEKNVIAYTMDFDRLRSATTPEEIQAGINKAKNASYTPYYAPQQDLEKYMTTNNILDIKPNDDLSKPGYKITYKNATFAYKTATELADLALTDKARQQFAVEAKVKLYQDSKVHSEGIRGAAKDYVANGVLELQQIRNINVGAIADKQKEINDLGDRDDQKERKAILKSGIDLLESHNKTLDKYMDRYTSYSKDDKTSTDDLQNLAVDMQGRSDTEEYINRAGRAMAERQSDQGTFTTDEAYFKNQMLPYEKAKAKAEADKVREESAKAQGILDAEVNPTGTVINDLTDTKINSLSTVDDVEAFKNQLTYEHMWIKAGAYGDFFKIQDYGQNFQDLDISNQRDLAQTLKFGDVNESSNGYIKKIKDETLKSIEKGNLDIEPSDLDKMTVADLHTVMFGKYQKLKKLYYDEDASVNLDDSQVNIFQRLDEVDKKVKDKQKILDKLNIRKEINKFSEEKLVFNIYPGVDLKISEFVTDNGGIDRNKFSEYLNLLKTHYKLNDDKIKVIRERFMLRYNEFVKPELNKIIKSKINSEDRGSILGRNAVVYEGANASGFYKGNLLGLPTALSATAMRVDNKSQGVATDQQTPIIVDKWFDELNSDMQKEVIKLIQGATREEMKNITVFGDGSFRLQIKEGDVTQKSKEDESSVKLTSMITNFIAGGSTDDEKAERSKIVQSLGTEGIRIDNFQPVENLARLNPTMVRLISGDDDVSLISNPSKNFNVKAESFRDSYGGTTYKVTQNFMIPSTDEKGVMSMKYDDKGAPIGINFESKKESSTYDHAGMTQWANEEARRTLTLTANRSRDIYNFYSNSENFAALLILLKENEIDYTKLTDDILTEAYPKLLLRLKKKK